MARRPIVAVWILCLCTQISGCGEKQEDTSEALKFFGLTYYNYHEIWNVAPESWDDILTLSEEPGLEEDRKKILHAKNSGYIVVWGMDPKSSSASGTVLAYHPDAFTDGGEILFADGSLRKLSADEFRGRAEPDE